jgi:hypothetical protein
MRASVADVMKHFSVSKFLYLARWSIS